MDTYELAKKFKHFRTTDVTDALDAVGRQDDHPDGRADQAALAGHPLLGPGRDDPRAAGQRAHAGAVARGRGPVALDLVRRARPDGGRRGGQARLRRRDRHGRLPGDGHLGLEQRARHDRPRRGRRADRRLRARHRRADHAEDADRLPGARPPDHPRRGSRSRPSTSRSPAAACWCAPGDIVGCDGDGALVVPTEVAEDVVEIAARILVDDAKGRRRLYDQLGHAARRDGRGRGAWRRSTPTTSERATGSRRCRFPPIAPPEDAPSPVPLPEGEGTRQEPRRPAGWGSSTAAVHPPRCPLPV